MTDFVNGLHGSVEALGERLETLSQSDLDRATEIDTALALEEIGSRITHLTTYIDCLTAAEASNEDYVAEQARLSELKAKVEILTSQFEARLRAHSEEEFTDLVNTEELQSASYQLERLRKQSLWRMSLKEEALAAELSVTAKDAWSRLYDGVSARLEFDMKFPDGSTKRLPISQCRSLMSNADRRIREAAFTGGEAAWKEVAPLTMSALNGISGSRLILCRHRGGQHFLEPALFDAGIERETLDALFEAIDTRLETSREIVKFKAERLGLDAISWYDLESAFPQKSEAASESIDWDAAVSWVSRSFHASYPKLGEFFDEICEAKWIDWRPRASKRPGAFCTTSDFNGESRVFMTYNACPHDIMTLAHEVGHAFHSHILKGKRHWEKGYPMTLAESASTFAELILIDGIIEAEDIDPSIKLHFLDEELNHSLSFLLDIPTRFYFEKALYEHRAEEELSVSALNRLMVETQRQIFGDSLKEGEENPYFWASKMHFYIGEVSFYNFPYTFGYLMSRSLFNSLKEHGSSFFGNYEQYLLDSGSMSCEDVAKKVLQADIRKADFWGSAIDSVQQTISRCKSLMAQV